MDDVLQNPTVEYRNTGEIETAKPASHVQGAVLDEESGIESELDLNRPTIVRQLVAV